MTPYQILSPTFGHGWLHALVSFFIALVMISLVYSFAINFPQVNVSFPGPETRLPYSVLESAQNSSWHRKGSQEIFVEQVNEQSGYALTGGF